LLKACHELQDPLVDPLIKLPLQRLIGFLTPYLALLRSQGVASGDPPNLRAHKIFGNQDR
jgi:hypothetical protein